MLYLCFITIVEGRSRRFQGEAHQEDVTREFQRLKPSTVLPKSGEVLIIPACLGPQNCPARVLQKCLMSSPCSLIPFPLQQGTFGGQIAYFLRIFGYIVEGSEILKAHKP